MPRRRCLWLLIVVGLFTSSGANCPRMTNPFARPPQLPPVLPAAPSIEQVIEVVNRNNGQIESFSTSNATMSAAGLSPTLRANIAFQRSHRLRVRADLMSSPEVDLGSNDEGFWFWVKRSQPPAVFWCRHDQFATSPARQMIPLEPAWFVDALGLALFDPALPHQGPIQLPGGRLQIDTLRETPQGPMRKVTIVDANQGWVLEQRLHDAQGQLLASSTTSGHQQDYVTGLWMARMVNINCPSAELAFRIDLGPQVRLNQLTGDPVELWAVPNYAGAPIVDIGRPDFRMPGMASQPPRGPYATRPGGLRR
jgi:hypothetical protein